MPESRRPRKSLRPLLTVAAHQLAAAIARADVPAGTASEHIVAGEWEISISVSPVAPDRPALTQEARGAVLAEIVGAFSSTAHDDGISPTEAAILSVCSKETPRKAVWIAHKIDRECNAYFRGVLAKLVRGGHLKKGDGWGYLLT